MSISLQQLAMLMLADFLFSFLFYTAHNCTKFDFCPRSMASKLGLGQEEGNLILFLHDKSHLKRKSPKEQAYAKLAGNF
jgi:hypothetical protein